MIEDVAFADAVFDTLVACYFSYPGYYPIGHTNMIDEKLPRGSPLRRFILDVRIYDGDDDEQFSDTLVGLSENVTKDILAGMLKIKGDQESGMLEPNDAPYLNGDKCTYHQHKTADEPCYLESKLQD